MNDRAKLWWRQWESNPPHGDCKSSSPSLGTFAPIIKRQQVIITFIITQLNDLYSCESVLKVFLGEEFVVYFERVGGIEPSSLDWKSNIISHYTTPANLGRIRRVLSTETSSLFYVSRQSVPRHYCEPGGSRTHNPKNFRLKKACLPISPQVHFVADYEGFEPSTYRLTAECSTAELIVHLIVEVPNGFEPLSLGYKARIISHYTKRPIKECY